MKRSTILSLVAVTALFVFAFIVPIIPLGITHNPSYGIGSNVCPQYSTCPIILVTGFHFTSISYAIFGVGGYLFINKFKVAFTVVL